MNRYLHPMVLLLCACAPEPEVDAAAPKGRLELSWHVPEGCDGAGLDEVLLVSGDRVLAAASCGEGELAARVRAGLHLVRVEGLDHAGVSRYAAEAGAMIEEGETSALPTLVLESLPATVDVTWYFDNARLCATNGVVTVEAAAFEQGTRVAGVEAGCDQGGARLVGLPAGEYLLDVVGRDADGRAVYTGGAEIEVGKGDEIAVEIGLGPA
jgi:hypothetical protein